MSCRLIPNIILIFLLGCSSKEQGPEVVKVGSSSAPSSALDPASSGNFTNNLIKAMNAEQPKQPYGDPRCKESCEYGLCWYNETKSECETTSDADCLQAALCKNMGACSMAKASAKMNACFARSPADCENSRFCKTQGNCEAKLIYPPDSYLCVRPGFKGPDEKEAPRAKTIKAGGIEWSIEGKLAGLIDIQKLSCEPSGSFRACKITAQLPDGSGSLPDMIEGAIYDGSGTKLDYHYLRFRDIEVGGTGRVDFVIRDPDAVKVVIREGKL